MPKKNENELTWKDLEIGNIVVEPGSGSEYRTGDWKTERPILSKELCNKCGLCFIYCPEGCIQPDAEGWFIADLYYCKGCGICPVECPKDAIKMVGEEQ